MDPNAPTEGTRPLFISKHRPGPGGPLQPVIVTDNPIGDKRATSALIQGARTEDRPSTPTDKASIHWADDIESVGLPRSIRTPRGYMSPYVDQNGSPIQRNRRREELSPMERLDTTQRTEPFEGNNVPPNYERFLRELRAENPYPNLQRRPVGQPRGPRPMRQSFEVDHGLNSPSSSNVGPEPEGKVHTAGAELRGKRSRNIMERTNTMAGRDAAREREIREVHHKRVQLGEEDEEEASLYDEEDSQATLKASELNKHLLPQEIVSDPMDVDNTEV